MDEHPILLFDGVCNLCEASVQFIIKRDPQARFRFAPLQSKTGQELLRQRGLESGELSTMVLLDGGRHYTKSDAALRIARRLSKGWSLLAVAWVVPRPIRDWVYERIAANRYRWFGQKESCLVPTPELRSRFLDPGSSR